MLKKGWEDRTGPGGQVQCYYTKLDSYTMLHNEGTWVTLCNSQEERKGM